MCFVLFSPSSSSQLAASQQQQEEQEEQDILLAPAAAAAHLLQVFGSAFTSLSVTTDGEFKTSSGSSDKPKPAPGLHQNASRCGGKKFSAEF